MIATNTMASLVALVALVMCAEGIATSKPRALTFPTNGKFDYQIGGAYKPASDVKLISRDRTDSPVSGLYNICYINAFQTQPSEKSFWTKNHSDLLLKNGNSLFEDKDWPGEYFLDTTTDAKRQAIATILNGWIDECQTDGFQAIEPDNLDTFDRSKGLLTQEGNLALAKLIADHAHSKGLAIAQKNTGDIGSAGKDTAGFDFAVVEECQAFNECDKYSKVYGNNFVEIEYTDTKNAAKVFQTACSSRGSSVSVILRDRDVVPQGDDEYSYQEC